MSQISRRAFLRATAATVGSLSVSTALTGCVKTAPSSALTPATFNHGVASGDPLSSSVILWSRAVPQDGVNTVSLAWEVALDKGFKNIIRSGVLKTDGGRDYTVKLDLQDLNPGTEYFYRFVSGNQVSPVGRTKTLPLEGVEQVKFAVFSCANYPAGYFNVYQDAANLVDLDAVLHLGDYLYEYPMGGYATENAEEIGRALAKDNQGELLSLTDYRKRYALYRTDKGLQALHGAAPFIVVWDDHEITNDTWREGAENHNEGEGDFFQRRAAAIQAYYEWLPIRPPQGEQNPHIYRSFEFGKLVSLHMLDTRVIGRDKQLEYADYRDKQSGQFDLDRFKSELGDAQRTLMGKEQLAWLMQGIKGSQAKWQLLGQQILMGKMHMPAEIFASGDVKQAPAIIAELTKLKQAVLQGQALSEQQLTRINTLMPYNLDAWDGYPMEREMLYRAIRQQGKNLLVVAGDTHNAWYNKLTDHQGNQVGVEFATAGVSSPGMERYLQLTAQQAEELAQAMTLLIDDLQYCNLHQRGYLLLTINQQEAVGDWVFIDNILTTDYRVVARHQVKHKNIA